MMKSFRNIIICALALTTTGFVSCGDDDDFGPTIFDTVDHPLDRSSYSFPLDTFLKANFLEPFNVKMIYRMEDIGSDLQKNLTPADYKKSVDLAVLSKYLWFDVYKKYGTEQFLKSYSPRIIHVIGSKNYNPTQGTETLGVAEGGLKITLYNVNNLNPNNIDVMNEYFFKTMHHEFGHILDQTVLRPTAFNLISKSQYDATTWTSLPDSVAAGRGFVSPYASSQASEDWVELLANYITLDTLKWSQLIQSAWYEWEDIDMEQSEWMKRARGANLDTVGYYHETDNGDGKVYRRVCARNADDTVALLEGGKIDWQHKAGIYGDEVILQKLDMVRKWLKDNWNINLDDLRREVQQRQYMTNADGSFKFDFMGRLINRFTQPSETDPSISKMDELRNWVYQYKSLQK